MNTIKSRPGSAFTLIELLAVIAVIAILAAILIPVAAKVRASATRAATVTSVRQIGIAINAYANDNKGKLPGPSTIAIFPWYTKPVRETSLAHLFNYLAPYYSLPDTNERNISDLLSCPALSDSAQSSIRTANYIRTNGPADHDLADRPWGPYASAEEGAPFLTMGYAEQSGNQPPVLAGLSERARNTAILCTADKQVWNSGDNVLLPETGALNGKRIFLFIDGSVSEPTTEKQLVR